MNGEIEEGHTIRVAAPSVEKPLNNNNNSEYSKYRSNNMPQRSPFAIQELLGLSEPSGGSLHRSPTAGVSAITPHGPHGYFPHHHQMSMAAVNASRMAYFNAQAAVAAFFPHNMNSIAAAMSPGPAPPSSAVLAHNNTHDTSKIEVVTVKFKRLHRIEGFSLPIGGYRSVGASGYDLLANIRRSVTLQPGKMQTISTGMSIEIPVGYEGQIRSRSGLASVFGVTVLNAPGTIDADFRGVLRVILINHGDFPYTVEPLDRIAQLVLSKVSRISFEVVDELSSTERNVGGFGSTGR